MAFNRNKRSRGAGECSVGTSTLTVRSRRAKDLASLERGKNKTTTTQLLLLQKELRSAGAAPCSRRTGSELHPAHTKMRLYQALRLSKLLLMQSLYLLSSTGTGAHVSLFSRQKRKNSHK